MGDRGKYKTKQRDLILSCLRKNRSLPVSAEKIMEYLKAEGESVGLTTVYRNLNRLAGEGLVLRYAPVEGMGARYQFVEHPDDHSSYYHLICTECGQMTDFRCEYIDDLFVHMHDRHQFDLDKRKTLLYGICHNCAGK